MPCPQIHREVEQSTAENWLLWSRGKRAGFTVVELLIVIVVIAILATIVVAAYTGIQDRARVVAADSAAKQVSTKVALFAVESGGSYPAALRDVGISDSASTTYQYRVDNESAPASWCATVTVGNKSAVVSNVETAPREGSCPGHGAGGQAPVTNLALNPRMVADGTRDEMLGRWGWVTSFPTLGDGPEGIPTYMRITASSGSTGTGRGIDWYQNPDITPATSTRALRQPVAEGEEVTVSVWARVSRATEVRIVWRIHDGEAHWQTPQAHAAVTQLSAGTWTRVSATFTAPSGGYLALRTNVTAQDWASTDWLDQTGLMITKGGLTGYADGTSPGWIWNGPPNNSTSTGRAP